MRDSLRLRQRLVIAVGLPALAALACDGDAPAADGPAKVAKAEKPGKPEKPAKKSKGETLDKPDKAEKQEKFERKSPADARKEAAPPAAGDDAKPSADAAKP
ncbi:MAG: hypothetical protein IAG13_33340, partial [Deltaproteobacteria bacterium]|nr:hypothetical protein [Nannocystaceae bacterium]